MNIQEQEAATVRAHHREACLDAIQRELPAMQFSNVLDRIEKVMTGRSIQQVVDLFRAGLA